MDWLYNTNNPYIPSSLELSDIKVGDIVFSQIDNKQGRIAKIISANEIRVSFSHSKWDYKYRTLATLQPTSENK
jgi:hypothetical protein